MWPIRSLADHSPSPVVAGRASSSSGRPSSSSSSRAWPARMVSSASALVGAAIAGLPGRLGTGSLGGWHLGGSSLRDGQVPPRMPGPGRPAQVDVDVLDLPVLVDPDLSVLPPDPRLLVAAEWEPRVDH